MFIYNLKLNKKAISRVFIICSFIIILAIIFFSIYIIFFKNHNQSSNDVKFDEIIDLNEKNYTNILKAANEDIDSYVGVKVRVIGYVYRLLDFDKNEFVVARDMRFNQDNQSLVVGFLCNYDDAYKYSDGTWVEVVGKIKKGKFNGNIAMLDIISIKETNAPENIFVNPPDKTYIPTLLNLSN